MDERQGIDRDARIALVVEKRRGEGNPILAGQFEWEGDGLPDRADFIEAVETAYDLIEVS